MQIPRQQRVWRQVTLLPMWLAVGFIRCYQWGVSPLLGHGAGFSRHAANTV